MNPTAPALFEETPAPGPPAAVGLAPAATRLVVTNSPGMTDPERRPQLLLVVHGPYCDHTHIHPAGHVGQPRLCLRRSRCVGTPGGSYYFPEVSQ